MAPGAVSVHTSTRGQVEPLLRVAFVIELLGADVIAGRGHDRRRQPGEVHGGRRGRCPGVAREMEIDDQIAEGSHREGDRIAQHRRARLDGDRRMAAEGQVDAPGDRAAGPRGDVGGADLERLGAEQVREGHPAPATRRCWSGRPAESSGSAPAPACAAPASAPLPPAPRAAAARPRGAPSPRCRPTGPARPKRQEWQGGPRRRRPGRVRGYARPRPEEPDRRAAGTCNSSE